MKPKIFEDSYHKIVRYATLQYVGVRVYEFDKHIDGCKHTVPAEKISMWIACKCKYDTYDSHLSFRLIFCVKFHKLEGALLPKHKFEEMYPSTEYFTVYIHYKKIH